MSSTQTLAAVAAAVVLFAVPASARPDHPRVHLRHHVQARQPFGHDRAPYPQAYGGYYGSAGWEAATNARLTAQAYREPGVTLELAPDAKQTATGGPSGGVPGFSGF